MGAGLRPDQSGKPFGNQDLSRRLSRDNRSVAAHRCDLKQGSGNIHKSTQMSKRIPQDARTAQRSYRGRIYAFPGLRPEKWPLRGSSPGYKGSHYQAIQDEVRKLLQALKIPA